MYTVYVNSIWTGAYHLRYAPPLISSLYLVFIYLIMSMFSGQIDAGVGFAETKTLSCSLWSPALFDRNVSQQNFYILDS